MTKEEKVTIELTREQFTDVMCALINAVNGWNNEMVECPTLIDSPYTDFMGYYKQSLELYKFFWLIEIEQRWDIYD